MSVAPLGPESIEQMCAAASSSGVRPDLAFRAFTSAPASTSIVIMSNCFERLVRVLLVALWRGVHPNQWASTFRGPPSRTARTAGAWRCPTMADCTRCKSGCPSALVSSALPPASKYSAMACDRACFAACSTSGGKIPSICAYLRPRIRLDLHEHTRNSQD